MKSIFKLFAILLFCIAQGHGGQLPDAPSKFWTRSNAVLVAADAAAKAQDGYRTNANLSIGGRETDAVARPFVTHGTPLRASFFAGCFALDAFAAYELTKHHHPKLATAVLLGGITYSTSGAVASTTARTPAR